MMFSRHKGAFVREVDRHAIAACLETLDGHSQQPVRCVKRVGAEADIRPVGRLIEVAGQWPVWKAVAIDQQHDGMPGQRKVHLVIQGLVMRPVPGVDQLCATLWGRRMPQGAIVRGAGIDHAHSPRRHGLLGIIEKPLGVDHKAADRKHHHGMIATRSAEDQFSAVVGHAYLLLFQFSVVQQQFGAGFGRNPGGVVRDVHDDGRGHLSPP